MPTAKSSTSKKPPKPAAQKKAKPASPKAVSYAAKRRDLTERLNKLRAESKELAANASQLLARITERNRA